MKFTEAVRKYAADSSGARKISHRLTRRASRTASQQAISEEEALAKGMAEPSKARPTIRRIARQGETQWSQKSKEFVEKSAEVYAQA